MHFLFTPIVYPCSHCDLGTLDSKKIQGKILLCNHSTNDTSEIAKMQELKSLGAAGAILIDDIERAVASTFDSFPATMISSQAADEIHSYMNSTKYVKKHI